MDYMRITGTVHEDQYTFLFISRSVLFRKENISEKSCRKHQNTQFMFNNFLCQNHVVYEIKLKYVLDPDTPQMTIRRMRFACWISKATDANSGYVILIAFPRNNGYANASQCYV
jgi:hypothetical protein